MMGMLKWTVEQKTEVKEQTSLRAAELLDQLLGGAVSLKK